MIIQGLFWIAGILVGFVTIYIIVRLVGHAWHRSRPSLGILQHWKLHYYKKSRGKRR